MSVIESEAPDLVWGCAAIAAVIHRNQRQTFYLLESGRLPARKVGRLWAASRKKLLAAITGDQASA
jgi:hypothetical protein